MQKVQLAIRFKFFYSAFLATLIKLPKTGGDEFYSNLTVAAVSSVTGKGFDELIASLPTLIDEYEQ